MKVTTVVGGVQGCGGGTCPTIYKTDRGTFVVQGNLINPSEAGISVPAHEGVVEIPLALVRELTEKFANGR